MVRLSRQWPALCLATLMAAALAACSGSAGGSGASPVSAVPPVMEQSQLAPIALSDDDSDSMLPQRLAPIDIVAGGENGKDNMFHPHDGDAKAGGHGKTVGKIPCDTTEYINQYHIHAFLGIIYNGKEIALPDAIGMVGPGPETNGFIATASCFYFIHTHDASGLIHIEDPANLPYSQTVYALKDFLSIWGIKTSATQFGPLKGSIKVFVGQVPSLGALTVEPSAYKGYKNVAHINSIALRSHEAIWIEIGKPYVAAKRLPSVTFYTEY